MPEFTQRSVKDLSVELETDRPEKSPLLLQLERYLDPKKVKELVDHLLEADKAASRKLEDTLFISNAVAYKYLKQILDPEIKVDIHEIPEEERLSPIRLPIVEWLPPKTQSLMQDFCDLLIEGHNQPIITDTYEDNHGERRQMRLFLRHILDGVFHHLLNESKLRRTLSFGIYLSISKSDIQMNKPYDNPQIHAFFQDYKKILTDFEAQLATITPDKDKIQKAIEIDEALLQGTTIAYADQTSVLSEYDRWPLDSKIYFAENINPFIRSFVSNIKELFEKYKQQQ